MRGIVHMLDGGDVGDVWGDVEQVGEWYIELIHLPGSEICLVSIMVSSNSTSWDDLLGSMQRTLEHDQSAALLML